MENQTNKLQSFLQNATPPENQPPQTPNPRHKKWIVGACLAIVLIAAGLGLFIYSSSKKPQPATKPAKQASPVQADKTPEQIKSDFLSKSKLSFPSSTSETLLQDPPADLSYFIPKEASQTVIKHMQYPNNKTGYLITFFVNLPLDESYHLSFYNPMTDGMLAQKGIWKQLQGNKGISNGYQFRMVEAQGQTESAQFRYESTDFKNLGTSVMIQSISN